MQTKDHLALGHYLAYTFEINQSVNYYAFVLGNIMPDINKFSYIRGYFQLLDENKREKKTRHLTINDHRRMLIGGHTAEGSRFFVNRTYRKLTKKVNLTLWDYYRLGKAMHYLADRFTYPHTMLYYDGFFSHIRYEKELHYHMYNMLTRIPDVRFLVKKCFAHIDFNGMYRSYRKEAGKPEYDCLYILAVCIAYFDNILYNKYIIFGKNGEGDDRWGG